MILHYFEYQLRGASGSALVYTADLDAAMDFFRERLSQEYSPEISAEIMETGITRVREWAPGMVLLHRNEHYARQE